jgi:1-phosphatidylinositol-4-phosphate 5-kinase
LFTNSEVYYGDYVAGKFNGRGKYIWKNKTQYVGDFRNGFMEGEGIWKSKKDSYKGQYYKNMKHGYGIYRWGNGRFY